MGETAKRETVYPIGFHLSGIAYSFERFAFYGTKPLLILFLTASIATGGLGLNEFEAGILTANFTAWTYIAPVVGGYICDNWLGARYAVSIGAILMGIGYLFGWKATSSTTIWLMIIIVTIGTGLFKGNLVSLMGRMIHDPSKKDSAYSIIYAFVNVGAMLGSGIMGFLYMTTFKHGNVLGYREVFLFCAILVMAGGVFFTLCWGKLNGQGKLPFKYIVDDNGEIVSVEEGNSNEEKEKLEANKPLESYQKSRVAAILIVTFVSIIFWLFYFQQDIALTLYMAKNVDMTIGGITLSPAHVTTTWNGLLCVILSLAAARLWNKLAQRPQGDLSMFKKISLAFMFLGLAYCVLIVMETVRGVGAPASHKVGVIWLLAFGFVLTLGEISFSPLGSSFVSKYAPKKYLSLLMGVWFFATFAANQINGIMIKFIEQLGIYDIFVIFAIVSFVAMAFMFFADKKLKLLLHDDKPTDE